MIKTLRQRIERVLAFSNELARGLRREFQSQWGASDRTQEAEELVRRVNALHASVEQCKKAYEAASHAIPTVELAALQAVDLNTTSQLARGLDALARTVREQLAASKPEPQTLPDGLAERLPGGKTGKLAQWANSAQVREVTSTGLLSKARAFLQAAAADPDVTGAKPAAPAGIDPTTERQRQAFEGAFKLVGDILAYVTPRLSLVRVALGTTGLPGRKHPWEQVAGSLMGAARAANIPNGQMARLAHITKLLYGDMNATRKAHQAVVQLDQAETLHGDAELLDHGLKMAPPAEIGGLLARFDLAKYRAAIFPLSHIHTAFQGLPHLSELFPPPAGVQSTSKLALNANA